MGLSISIDGLGALECAGMGAVLLQWGHRHASTESRQRVTHGSATATSFNGAVDMLRRSPTPTSDFERARAETSMKPSIYFDGDLWHQQATDCGRHTSMEPSTCFDGSLRRQQVPSPEAVASMAPSKYFDGDR
jgi:hypothetical protein